MSRRGGRARSDRGAAAVLTALLLAPVLMAAAAIGVEVARWLAVLERVQSAADAAALAAAPLWPSDRTRAREAALAVARANGFARAASLTLTSGSVPGSVRATISTTVSNPLGAAVGVPTRALARSAEAVHAQPLSLGSSCNLFGNEPDPASGDGTDPADGSGSARSGLCPYGRNPHFWASVAGPETSKSYGDRYTARWCLAGNTGCRGSVNADYAGSAPGAADGQPWYFYRVTVRRPVAWFRVQVFDAAQVDVGDRCQRMPRRSATDPAWPGSQRPNRYVTDAVTRYASGNPASSPPSDGRFCTGDGIVASPGTPVTSPVPMVTSMAVHAPTPSGDPWRAPVVPTCVRQYPGFSMTATALRAALESASPLDRPLQRLFRQWVTVCTIRAPEVGDYYLQVRTNLRWGAATAARMADPREDPAARGSGQNRYALRVDSDSPDAVAVSAVERMVLYSNIAGGPSSFLLARVPSAHAGSSLQVDLFDVGDARGEVAVEVTRPAEAAGTWADPCLALGEPRGSPSAPVTLSGCRLTGVGSLLGYNGRAQRISVPLPDDYRCADTRPDGCWFGIRVEYQVDLFDTTTWSAWVEGDPVRLVR